MVNCKRRIALVLIVSGILLTSCTQEMEPFKADRGGWLYQAAHEVHQAEVSSGFSVNEDDFEAYSILAKNHQCVWFFYNNPNLSRDHSEFVYCFEPKTRNFAFRL